MPDDPTTPASDHPEPACPDCGRQKARNMGDVFANACPKWWAIRDPDAAKDCERVRRHSEREPLAGFAKGTFEVRDDFNIPQEIVDSHPEREQGQQGEPPALTEQQLGYIEVHPTSEGPRCTARRMAVARLRYLESRVKELEQQREGTQKSCQHVIDPSSTVLRCRCCGELLAWNKANDLTVLPPASDAGKE